MIFFFSTVIKYMRTPHLFNSTTMNKIHCNLIRSTNWHCFSSRFQGIVCNFHHFRFGWVIYRLYLMQEFDDLLIKSNGENARILLNICIDLSIVLSTEYTQFTPKIGSLSNRRVIRMKYCTKNRICYLNLFHITTIFPSINNKKTALRQMEKFYCATWMCSLLYKFFSLYTLCVLIEFSV